jgi:hypothetical protein
LKRFFKRHLSRERIAWVVVLVLAATTAILAAGISCDGGKLDPQATNAKGEQLVTQEQIDRKAVNSPERVLFEWWRSLQYNDIVGYNDALSNAARTGTTLAAAERNLARVSPALRYERPSVSSRSFDGPRRVTLYVIVTAHSAVGGKRFITTTYPQAFAMVREAGGWRLASDQFIRSKLRTIGQ